MTRTFATALLITLFISVCGQGLDHAFAQSDVQLDPKNPKHSATISVGINTNLISENHFNLNGYTSPHAKVTIINPTLYDDTYAKEDGYFEFKNKLISLVQEEVCLTTQDELGRISIPTCIPPIPDEEGITIGPVLLSPTVSLTAGNVFIGDTVILSGQTIPGTEVKLSMFTDEKKAVKNTIAYKQLQPLARIIQLFTHPISPVEAYGLAPQKIKSDTKGYYSVRLPSDNAQYYRMFTQTTFLESFSPKSVTLSLDVYPAWMLIIKYIFAFFNAIKTRLIEILIVTQIAVVFIVLLRKYLHPFRLVHQKGLKYPLALLPERAITYPEHMLLLTDHPLLKQANTLVKK